jgi:hypothetical protein
MSLRPKAGAGDLRLIGLVADMRVYEGAPRRDYEEALRSVGATLDSDVLNSVMLVELEQGFFGTGLRYSADTSRDGESLGRYEHVQVNFNEDEIGAALERGYERRGKDHESFLYERALRVIGRWIDDEHASKLLLIEQAGSFIVRVMMPTPGETLFTIAEFTPDDIDNLAQGAGIARR